MLYCVWKFIWKAVFSAEQCMTLLNLRAPPEHLLVCPPLISNVLCISNALRCQQGSILHAALLTIVVSENVLLTCVWMHSMCTSFMYHTSIACVVLEMCKLLVLYGHCWAWNASFTPIKLGMYLLRHVSVIVVTSLLLNQCIYFEYSSSLGWLIFSV